MPYAKNSASHHFGTAALPKVPMPIGPTRNCASRPARQLPTYAKRTRKQLIDVAKKRWVERTNTGNLSESALRPCRNGLGDGC
jgi:hypothetical protein